MFKDTPEGQTHYFRDGCVPTHQEPYVILSKVLETIEKIASVNNKHEKNKVLNDIYKIAHAFSGTCKHPHEDWKELEAEIAEKLQDY